MSGTGWTITSNWLKLESQKGVPASKFIRNRQEMHNIRHVVRIKALQWSRIRLSGRNTEKGFSWLLKWCEMSGQTAKQTNSGSKFLKPSNPQFPSALQNSSEALRQTLQSISLPFQSIIQFSTARATEVQLSDAALQIPARSIFKHRRSHFASNQWTGN